jgi:hypothetical protein
VIKCSSLGRERRVGQGEGVKEHGEGASESERRVGGGGSVLIMARA